MKAPSSFTKPEGTNVYVPAVVQHDCYPAGTIEELYTPPSGCELTETYVGTAYDKVAVVADNIEEVIKVATMIGTDVASLVDSILIQLGHNIVGSFELGATVTKPTDYVTFKSEPYHYIGSVFPYEVSKLSEPNSDFEKGYRGSVSDWDAFDEVLLAYAGLAQTGTPDTTTYSYRLDALRKLGLSRAWKSGGEVTSTNELLRYGLNDYVATVVPVTMGESPVGDSNFQRYTVTMDDVVPGVVDVVKQYRDECQAFSTAAGNNALSAEVSAQKAMDEAARAMQYTQDTETLRDEVIPLHQEVVDTAVIVASDKNDITTMKDEVATNTQEVSDKHSDVVSKTTLVNTQYADILVKANEVDNKAANVTAQTAIATDAANRSSSSATTASDSADRASVSASNANTSAVAADAAKVISETNADITIAKATEATNAATAANGSATSAVNSATNASQSATESAASAQTAVNAVNEIGSAVADSQAAATQAALSATAAAESERNAEIYKTASEAAKLAAETSVTQAQGFANSASVSATTATTKAGEASANATIATDAKDAAKVSETNAATFKTGAEQARDVAITKSAEALDSANRAKDALDSITTLSIYRGTWDPEVTQAYPDNKGTSSQWDVSIASNTTVNFNGKDWKTGYRLVYSLPENAYYQIKMEVGVTSVDGKTGAVDLSADYAAKSVETTKADKTYVDTELAKKSDITYVNTELAKKADKTTVTALDAAKADKSDTYTKDEVNSIAADSIKVSSVNGKTGIVVLNNDDVGALAKTGGPITGSLSVSNKVTVGGTTHSNGMVTSGDSTYKAYIAASSTPNEVTMGMTSTTVSNHYIRLGVDKLQYFTGGVLTNIYHTGFKPTWDDIGGNSYFSKNASGHLVPQGSNPWIRAYDEGKGFLPASDLTGNNAVSYLGLSSSWFKEAWVNNYRGWGATLTGDVTIGGKFKTTTSGEAITIQMPSNDITSTGYVTWKQSSGSRLGYLGLATNGNNDLYMTSDVGNVRLLPAAGKFTRITSPISATAQGTTEDALVRRDFVENMWAINTTQSDHLEAQNKWVVASPSRGFIPAANGDGLLGTTSNRWFQSWVNTYRGSEIDISGNASIGGKLRTKGAIYQQNDGRTWGMGMVTSSSTNKGGVGLTLDNGVTFSDYIRFGPNRELVHHVTVNNAPEEYNVYTQYNKPTLTELGALGKTEKAADSDKLDGLDSSQFLRSDTANFLTTKLVSSDTNRSAGMYGSYDSTKISHIWSIGTKYTIDNAGANFGNLYGFAYKNTSNTTGGTMADGHQAVWCHNGVPQVSLGINIWAKGKIYEQGALLESRYLGLTAKAADSAKLNGVVNSSGATANTIAQRDSSGDIQARLFRSSYQNQTTSIPEGAGIAYRVSPSGDNYIRFCTDKEVIRNFLEVGSAESVGFLIGTEQQFPPMPVGKTPGDMWVAKDGSLISRTSHPALWQWAQDSGLVVTETKWQEIKANSHGGAVAVYSSGDGATNFRVPSIGSFGMVQRPMANGVDGSNEAYLKGYEDQNKAHVHSAVAAKAGVHHHGSNTPNEKALNAEYGSGKPSSVNTNSLGRHAATTDEGEHDHQVIIDSEGGSEATMKHMWCSIWIYSGKDDSKTPAPPVEAVARIVALENQMQSLQIVDLGTF